MRKAASGCFSDCHLEIDYSWGIIIPSRGRLVSMIVFVRVESLASSWSKKNKSKNEYFSQHRASDGA